MLKDSRGRGVTGLPKDVPGRYWSRVIMTASRTAFPSFPQQPMCSLELQESARGVGVICEDLHSMDSGGLEDGRGEGRVAKF